MRDFVEKLRFISYIILIGVMFLLGFSPIVLGILITPWIFITLIVTVPLSIMGGCDMILNL